MTDKDDGGGKAFRMNDEELRKRLVANLDDAEEQELAYRAQIHLLKSGKRDMVYWFLLIKRFDRLAARALHKAQANERKGSKYNKQMSHLLAENKLNGISETTRGACLKLAVHWRECWDWLDSGDCPARHKSAGPQVWLREFKKVRPDLFPKPEKSEEEEEEQAEKEAKRKRSEMPVKELVHLAPQEIAEAIIEVGGEEEIDSFPDIARTLLKRYDVAGKFLSSNMPPQELVVQLCDMFPDPADRKDLIERLMDSVAFDTNPPVTIEGDKPVETPIEKPKKKGSKKKPKVEEPKPSEEPQPEEEVVQSEPPAETVEEPKPEEPVEEIASDQAEAIEEIREILDEPQPANDEGEEPTEMAASPTVH